MRSIVDNSIIEQTEDVLNGGDFFKILIQRNLIS